MKNTKLLRKIPAVMLSGMMLLAQTGALAEAATVKGGALNLRQEASLDAKVLSQYRTGTWVDITEKGETWSKVTVDGKTGYMMTKYLSTDASANKDMYVRTNTGIGLNLRKEPAMTGAIVTSFPIGTKVTVLKSGNEWSYVQVGEQKGYMSTRYLTASTLPSYTKPVTPYTATLVNINGGSIVNFRLYPGMKTKVIKTLAVGTEVKVLEKGENWSLVEVNGQQGYVSTYFLKTK